MYNNDVKRSAIWYGMILIIASIFFGAIKLGLWVAFTYLSVVFALVSVVFAFKCIEQRREIHGLVILGVLAVLAAIGFTKKVTLFGNTFNSFFSAVVLADIITIPVTYLSFIGCKENPKFNAKILKPLMIVLSIATVLVIATHFSYTKMTYFIFDSANVKLESYSIKEQAKKMTKGEVLKEAIETLRNSDEEVFDKINISNAIGETPYHKYHKIHCGDVNYSNIHKGYYRIVMLQGKGENMETFYVDSNYRVYDENLKLIK